MTPAVSSRVAEIIARRSTFDGKHVCLWSDGSLTWALGYTIRGSANPRTEQQIEEALRAGWLVLGEVEIVNAEDVSRLVEASRWVAARFGLPGDVRTRFHARAPMRPQWTVLQTDRTGRPTLRAWVFHRMSALAGMAIWNEGGRFQVMNEMRGQRAAGVYMAAGGKVGTLREALALAQQMARR